MNKPDPRPLTPVVGLTGGIGAGKSEVLRILGGMGAAVLQADQVGHALLRERHFSKVLAAKFGKDILDTRGLVDRRKLGSIVFKSAGKRKALNQLLHPLIRQKIKRWVAERQRLRRQPPFLAVVEIPLLFEGKGYPYLEGVLSVSASSAVRHRRLLGRGWNQSEILRREKGQWAQARKDKRAHWVIQNNGSLRELKEKVKRWLKQIDKKT
jgi:dephospho-CoA kinase